MDVVWMLLIMNASLIRGGREGGKREDGGAQIGLSVVVVVAVPVPATNDANDDDDDAT